MHKPLHGVNNMSLIWTSGAQKHPLHQPCQGGVVTSTTASPFSQTAFFSVSFFYKSSDQGSAISCWISGIHLAHVGGCFSQICCIWENTIWFGEKKKRKGSWKLPKIWGVWTSLVTSKSFCHYCNSHCLAQLSSGFVETPQKSQGLFFHPHFVCLRLQQFHHCLRLLFNNWKISLPEISRSPTTYFTSPFVLCRI